MKILKIFKFRNIFLFPLPSTLPPSSGFTILEILVVFTMVAALSALGFASFVNYSRSQVVNQSANDIKLLIGQAKANSQSAVKSNTDINGNRINCYNVDSPEVDKNEKLLGYSVVKVGTQQLELNQICENLPDALLRVINLKDNVEFDIQTTCTTIMFDSLTSNVTGPCIFVITGFGDDNNTKTVTVDGVGNVSIQ